MFEVLMYILVISIVLIISLAVAHMVVVVPNRDYRIKELLEKGQSEEAILYLKTLLKKEPHNPHLLFKLAEIYWLLHHYDEAIGIYENLLENFPSKKGDEYQKILYHLASWYKKEGQIVYAFDLASKLLKIDPRPTAHQALMGDIFMLQENYRGALDHYKKAVSEDSKNVDVWRNMGDIYFLESQFNDAFGAYSRVIGLEPKSAFIWYRMGECSENLKDFSKALKFYEKSFSLGGGLVAFNATYQLAGIHDILKQPKQRLQALERARNIIKENPQLPIDNSKNILVRYDIAEYYLEDGNAELAVLEWAAILKLTSNYRDTREKYENHSALQLNDLFKDMLTNSGVELINNLSTFINSLGLTIDSCHPTSVEMIDIVASEMHGKWRNEKRRKLAFSFWCTTESVPLDLALRLAKYLHAQGVSKTCLISAGPVLSDVREALRQKSIEVYDRNNIMELINAQKELSKIR